MQDFEFWVVTLLAIGLLALLEAGVQHYKQKRKSAQIQRRILEG